MKEFVLIKADEWEGLYVNGELVAEDHSVDLDMVLRHVAPEINVKEEWIDGTNADTRLVLNGRLPTTLVELNRWKTKPLTKTEKEALG